MWTTLRPLLLKIDGGGFEGLCLGSNKQSHFFNDTKDPRWKFLTSLTSLFPCCGEFVAGRRFVFFCWTWTSPHRVNTPHLRRDIILRSISTPKIPLLDLPGMYGKSFNSDSDGSKSTPNEEGIFFQRYAPCNVNNCLLSLTLSTLNFFFVLLFAG